MDYVAEMGMYGFTKVRNEEEIIQDTLDHVGQWCEGIVVYDDVSTDATVEMCWDHPAVVAVIEGDHWDPDRFAAERDCRQKALEKVMQYDPAWLLCFDADERFVWPETDEWTQGFGLKMRLFDFYITADDVDLPYTERRWMGPEYRDILMVYRPFRSMRFRHRDQREMTLPRGIRPEFGGSVKHYGKAISVEQWEETCEYYATHFPEPYKTKWEQRRGQAVHTVSDYGRELITWEQREALGVKL